MNERTGSNMEQHGGGPQRQIPPEKTGRNLHEGKLFEKKTNPEHEQVRTHDRVLIGMRGIEGYIADPQTPEERMHNKYATVRRILKDFPTTSNRTFSPQEEHHAPALARRNLATIIDKNQITNYPEYRDPPYPHIDEHGYIIDNEQAQVITTIIMDGDSYYTSPYLTVLKPEALGADTKKVIPGDMHEYYLVPEEIDRREIQRELEGKVISEEAVAKIITYDEFIAQYGETLPDEWMHEETKEKQERKRIKEKMQFLTDSVRLARTWEEGADRYMENIQNSDDPAFKKAAMGYITSFPLGFYPQPTQEAVVERGQELFWTIARDKEEPVDVRNMALSDIIPNEEAVTQMLDFANDPDEATRIRRHAITKAGRFGDVDTIAQTLAAIARDPEESIEIRHHTLLSLQGAHDDVIDTYLSYLAGENEQGQKIAMRKLRDAQILDPDQRILDAVDQFAEQNTREDTKRYLSDFYKKFDYAIHPERYADDLPESWEEFEEHLDLSIQDFGNIRREDRLALENGLRLYLLQELRQGTIAIVDIGEGGKQHGDIVVSYDKTNDIGRIEEYNQLHFGGWGTTVPKEDRSLTYKKIVRIENTSDSS